MKQHSQKWLSNAEIQAILSELARLENPEPQAIFQLLLVTGQKYSKIQRAIWDNYNSNLNILQINNRQILLPEKLIKLLDYMRSFATSENQKIIKYSYHKFWWFFSGLCLKLKLRNSKIGIYLIRNTYAHRHFQFYKNKKKLALDMGLSTTRYLPNEIFKDTHYTLFQDVINA